jgi:tetratricopeptide (TPR) repeat protein
MSPARRLVLLAWLIIPAMAFAISPAERAGVLATELASIPPDDASADAQRLELAGLLVNQLRRAGDAEQVLALLPPVIARATTANPPDQALAAKCLVLLAQAQATLGQAAAADTFAQAVEHLIAAHGANHPKTLTGRLARAIYYSQTGRPADADAEAADIVTRFRDNDPDSADALQAYGQRAVFLMRLGRFDDAEVQIRDLLARHEKTGVLSPVEHLVQLNNLAYILMKTGRKAECATIMEQIVKVRTADLGRTSDRTLIARFNLAYVYGDLGRDDEAAALLRDDLALVETFENPGKLTPADYLGRLGEMDLRRNQPKEAAASLARAVDLLDHPPAGIVVHQEDATREKLRAALALAHQATGDDANARATTAQWLDRMEERFRARLTFTSERDRLAFQAREQPLDLPATLGDDALLARAVLHFKGLVLDSLLEDQQLAQASADPAVATLLAAYQAALTSADQNPVDPLLGDEVDRLERELARHTVTAAGHRRALQADPAAVLAALPAGTAVIEYLRYRDITGLPRQPAEHYLALVGSARGWQTIRLGAAGKVDAAVAKFQLLARRGGSFAWAEELHALVLAPVLAALPADVTTLYVSPDDALHRVPFDMLPDAAGRFAGETVGFIRIGSARDLLPSDQPTSSAAMPGLVLANPTPPPGRTELPDLPGAKDEGQAVQALLTEARLLVGAAASAQALTASGAVSHLHIAAHAVVPAATELNAADRLRATGLVLAGEDGFMDAYRIAGLNLHGTSLVFLSACETGAGESIPGEGIQGLTRAFIRAGTDSLIFTLWPVADQDGRPLIEACYQGIARGQSPSAALAAARRAAIQQERAQGRTRDEILQRIGAYAVVTNP